MTINVMNKVLWNVTPYSLVDGEQRFSVPCGVSVPSQHSYQTIHLHSPHQNLKVLFSVVRTTKVLAIGMHRIHIGMKCEQNKIWNLDYCYKCSLETLPVLSTELSASSLI
jgi:hypothetical protein